MRNREPTYYSDPFIEETVPGPPVETPKLTGVICNSAAVNVRKRPSPHAKILGVLENGDEVIILDRVQTIEPGYPPAYWIIEYGSGKGYIASKYCKEV